MSQRRSSSEDSATRDRLLAATTNLIARDGIAAATSRRITDEAGVNLAAITYWFGSKENLVDAALRDQVAALVEPALTILEGDGDPDVLVTESTMSLLHVLRRDLGAFLPTASYGVGGGPAAVHLADFSGDDVLDVVTANAGAGSVSLLLGNGFGQLGGASTSMAGAAPADAGSGDFNGDGHTDTIVANPGGFVTIGLGNGLGGLGGQLPFPVAGGPVALVTADLDLDGTVGAGDLAVLLAAWSV